MRRSTLVEAIAEAGRFIHKADTLLKASADHKNPSGMYNWPVEQGSVKRSSMDLTRKLAELRLGK
jgi:hypothetical protein